MKRIFLLAVTLTLGFAVAVSAQEVKEAAAESLDILAIDEVF